MKTFFFWKLIWLVYYSNISTQFNNMVNCDLSSNNNKIICLQYIIIGTNTNTNNTLMKSQNYVLKCQSVRRIFHITFKYCYPSRINLNSLSKIYLHSLFLCVIVRQVENLWRFTEWVALIIDVSEGWKSEGRMLYIC